MAVINTFIKSINYFDRYLNPKKQCLGNGFTSPAKNIHFGNNTHHLYSLKLLFNQLWLKRKPAYQNSFSIYFSLDYTTRLLLPCKNNVYTNKREHLIKRDVI